LMQDNLLEATDAWNGVWNMVAQANYSLVVWVP
jgi:hypothetical protein